ncbi:MAG: ATP-binding protein [Porphyromonadaceae bacterium]|nr:MAG: ATP-binding protein [Porphyromonadaceae bacterium]
MLLHFTKLYYTFVYNTKLYNMNVSPFQYGKIVTERAFVNRTREKELLIHHFQSGINTILISPRRWGKTSLVKESVRLTLDKGIKFVFIDLFSIRDEQEFLTIFAREVMMATMNKREELLKDARGWFKQLLPVMSFGIDPSSKISIKFNWEEAKKHRDEIINLPEIIAKKKKLRIVVCLDEFQNIARFPENLSIENELRSCWQHHQNVTYCLFGSKRHMMLELFNQSERPFYRFGDMILLEKIATAEWIPFIIDRFSECGKTISREHAEFIIRLMKNHPYYIQMYCDYTWTLTSDLVNKEILDRALEEMIDHTSFLFQEDLESLSITQLNLIKAISAGENQFTAKAVMDKYRLGTPHNVVKNKEVLRFKDILDTQGNQLSFLDPLFEIWLKKMF